LIDAATDAHLWADRFDSDAIDLFALQNEIASRIANALVRSWGPAVQMQSRTRQPGPEASRCELNDMPSF
jgi:adenylate cyclase